MEIYDKALKLNPEYAAAWYNRGNALSKMRKYSDAIRSYDRALDIDPDHAKAWNNKGTSLISLGRYQEAVYCYNRVLELDPKMLKPCTIKVPCLRMKRSIRMRLNLTISSWSWTPKMLRHGTIGGHRWGNLKTPGSNGILWHCLGFGSRFWTCKEG